MAQSQSKAKLTGLLVKVYGAQKKGKPGKGKGDSTNSSKVFTSIAPDGYISEEEDLPPPPPLVYCQCCGKGVHRTKLCESQGCAHRHCANCWQKGQGRWNRRKMLCRCHFPADSVDGAQKGAEVRGASNDPGN